MVIVVLLILVVLVAIVDFLLARRLLARFSFTKGER